LFVGSAALAAIGWLSGRYALSRVFPALMLAGQPALAVELARLVRRSADRRRWVRVTAWLDPFLDDEAQRKRDVAAMISAGTDDGTRVVLFARYHVRFILKIPWEWAPVEGRTLVATGPMGQQLYRV
jgi:hypothetical protein